MSSTKEDAESSQDKIERTFELLAAAKKLESESNYWLATEKFVAAHKLLGVLAVEESLKAEDAENSDDAENTRKIAALYGSKADEYWKQSRRCLIHAMEQEKTNDEEQQNDDTNGNGVTDGDPTVSCACALLDDEQARARNHSFSVLFSRPLVEKLSAQTSDGTEDTACPPDSAVKSASEEVVDENTEVKEDNNDSNDTEPIANEGELEARLRALNQSLPTGFKSVKERMSEVNKGLGKLGVSSVYTQSHASRIEDELPMSEDEQIDQIMAQARDEATMENAMRNAEGGEASPVKTTATHNKNDDDASSFGDDDSDDENGNDADEHLDNDQLAMKTIHKQVVKAQVKLAELLALVEEARSKRAKEDMDEEKDIYKNNGLDNEDSDDDSFRDIQKHDVAFLMMTGKKKLKSAQSNMKKALVEWEDLIL